MVFSINGHTQNLNPRTEIVPTPKEEKSLEIYGFISKLWGLDFYFDDDEELPFTTNEDFYIFASNSKAWFGTVGNASDLLSDNASIAIVLKTGVYGIVADSLKEFFNLCNFYPYWLDIVEGIVYQKKITFKDLTDEQLMCSKFIAEELKLKQNSHSLIKLIVKLQEKSTFNVISKESEKKFQPINWWDK